MATPNYNDRIVAKTGGAILYSYPPNDRWNWENQPVRLSENDYLFATGVDSQEGELMYQVYIYRRKGSGTVYKTQDSARGKGDILNGIGNLFTFSPDKVVKEYKWLKSSEVRIENDSANVNNSPDLGSSTAKEQMEKKDIEDRLNKEIYDPTPAQPKHTSLFKATDGKWMLVFPNQYVVEYEAFMKMLPDKRLTMTTAKVGKDGFTGDGNDPKGDGDGDKIPVWVYALLGGVALIAFMFLGLQRSGKKK